MSNKGRALITVIAIVALVAAMAFYIMTRAGAEDEKPQSMCVVCHTQSTPSVVAQFKESKHSKMGLDCATCHASQEGAPGAKKHFDGSFITPIVSPKVCGKCHETQEKEFSASYHASAAKFIGSLDNILGEMIEGGPASSLGCKQCHGSTVKAAKDGTLDSDTWPNYGIGRVNPDGSSGTCAACHARHSFTRSQAREPDTCGKCHMGPDHPQKEIFEESKHGIAFKANHDKMNMESMSWIAGKDYSAAPTCATCHMSATPGQEVTHDVGARISWTLRPAVSTKLQDWEARRESMQGACRQCHGITYVNNFYKQYDSAVNLYNDKFGKPAKDIMDQLHAEKLLTDTPFDEKLEWTYYLLWHHDGRSARHGAAMSGPDYVQWHGFFEVSRRFYTEFLPEVKALKPELAEKLLAQDDHKWMKGLPPDERAKILEFYKTRYGQ